MPAAQSEELRRRGRVLESWTSRSNVIRQWGAPCGQTSGDSAAQGYGVCRLPRLTVTVRSLFILTRCD